MRSMSSYITSMISFALLVGCLLLAAPKLLSYFELSSMPDKAIESLSTASLNIEKVTVEGRLNTSPADILEGLGAVRGKPILEISVPKAQQRLAALPWVQSVEIIRQLPNSLHIRLEEYIPFALWQHEGRYKLIARDGTPIKDVDYAQPSLTIIVGEDAPSHAAALFEELSSNPQLSKRVKAAVRLGKRRWNVILDSVDQGILIKLPEYNVSTAWNTLAIIDAKHGFLGRAISEVDLRISGRLTVKLLDGFENINPETTKKFPAQDAKWNIWMFQHKELADSV